MEDIFLSYSSKDADRVQRLRDALADHGFSVFWDHDVPPGTDWDTWIRQRLAQSRCAVVVWTSESIGSKNVRHEAVIAQNQNKLLSVMLDPVPAEQFPMGLYTTEAVNLSGWSGDPKAKEYLDLLAWIESRLTPTWIKNAMDARDLAVSSERSRREAAEGQVRLLRDQTARDAIERQRLEQERDASRAELAAAQAEAGRLQPRPSRARRLLRLGAVALLCAATGIAGYQLALSEANVSSPPVLEAANPSPPPVEPSPAEEPKKRFEATDLSVADCQVAAIDRLRRIKAELDITSNPTNQSLFNVAPPLTDLIERGWGTGQTRGWRLADLDRLCLTRANNKLIQCNWSIAQIEVLPGLSKPEIQERSRLASTVLEDLQSRANR